jgi:hypothetical protein
VCRKGGSVMCAGDRPTNGTHFKACTDSRSATPASPPTLKISPPNAGMTMRSVRTFNSHRTSRRSCKLSKAKTPSAPTRLALLRRHSRTEAGARAGARGRRRIVTAQSAAGDPATPAAALPVGHKDRHVLAAAVATDFELIVSFDTGDFAPDGCEPLASRQIHPDDFVLDLDDLDVDDLDPEPFAPRSNGRPPTSTHTGHSTTFCARQVAGVPRFADTIGTQH